MSSTCKGTPLSNRARRRERRIARDRSFAGTCWDDLTDPRAHCLQRGLDAGLTVTPKAEDADLVRPRRSFHDLDDDATSVSGVAARDEREHVEDPHRALPW